jgi:hypothetical protein
MRFNIVLVLCLATFQVLSAAELKKFIKPKATQSIMMNNKADSTSNALAVNAGIIGDANAFSVSNAGNYNMISQSSE